MRKSFIPIILASASLLTAQAFQSHSPSKSSFSIHSQRSTKEEKKRFQLYSALDISIPVSTALSDLDNFYRTAPYTAAFMTCGIKASAADFLAQKRELGSTAVEEKTNAQIEVERNLAFIVYGGVYQGIAQYYIYNVLFPLWFGSGNDLASVTMKVAFDMLVISPFLCLPIAYLTKSVIYGTSWKEGMEKYRYDLLNKGLLATYCKIWLPAQFITFGIVPEHLRIVFIAFVSFFWLIILSTVSSSKMEETEA